VTKFCALSEEFPSNEGDGYLLEKKRYFATIGSLSAKTVADRYRHVACHNKHWSQAF